MTDEIAIRSLGAPPERHADRVIAAMLRLLAKRRAQSAMAISEARRASKDGGERAQRHMVERIKRAGAIESATRHRACSHRAAYARAPAKAATGAGAGRAPAD